MGSVPIFEFMVQANETEPTTVFGALDQRRLNAVMPSDAQ